MKRLLTAMCLVVLVVCLSLESSLAAEVDNADKVFDAPLLKSIVIDGSMDDWQDNGLRIDVLTTVDGRAPIPGDFSCRVRLGWDEAGLLLVVTVQDDFFCEHAEANEFWREDSLGVLVAAKQDSKTYYQVNVAPGRDEQFDAWRAWLFDRGAWNYDDRLKIEAARTITDDGYIFEARLPWSNLPAEVTTGDEIAMQFGAGDCDSHGGERTYYRWYPADDAHRRTDHMHRIRLAETAGPAIRTRATGILVEESLSPGVRVAATLDQAGAPVEIRRDGQLLASGDLVPTNGWAMAEIALPAPEDLAAPEPVEVFVAGESVVTLALPDTPRLRAEAFLHMAPVAAESVFNGTDLPEVVFLRPQDVEKLFGPVELRTTYYDNEYREVTSAATPGRYGAVTEMRLADGRMFRRFTTLYRTPGRTNWDYGRVEAELKWPEEFGLNSTAVDARDRAISYYMMHVLDQSRKNDDRLAVLLAGLSSLPEGVAPDDYYTNPDMQDRQWWLGLKRKLYGWDQRWSEPLAAPRPIEGPPATTLREGTCAEAGIDEAKLAEIDALLTEWAAESKIPLAVCLARHGVVFHHKAYGTLKDGTEMTVDEPQWMASMTKLLGGVAMTVALDSGRMKLTDPAWEYLPPLAQSPTRPAMTLRHLYTHTADLDWHWGADLNDMEERIAVLLPHLHVGKEWRYNGTDMNLATKALEAVSGETLPRFFNNHILKPLGCEHTFLPDAGGSSRSIPMDLAKIAQMLLNRGAYGEMRFFSPETLEQFLPRPVDDLVGPTSDQPYGLGTSWCDGEGWGEGAYGHGAASGAIFRVIPAHDMVVIQTRNEEGLGYERWRKKFFKAVQEAIKD